MCAMDPNKNKFDERFDTIYKMLSGSVVRGIVFSIYDKFGPQNLYAFPPTKKQEKNGFGDTREERIEKKIEQYKENIENIPHKNASKSTRDSLIQSFTERDYLQIAIKSVSLLIGDKIFERDKSLLQLSFFGILPYPDLDVCAHTLFKFYAEKDADIPKAVTFSLLIDNNKRNFIYNNIDFLKKIISDVSDKLIYFLKEKKWNISKCEESVMNSINEIVIEFFMNLKLIQHRPLTPIISKRQIKIVFTGLKNSGKTSFLLSVNRKYSELIRRDHPESADISIANMLGITIVNWDVNKRIIPSNFRTQSEIYLYDANLIYYFVDGTNLSQLAKSKKIFESMLRNMKKLGISIPIFIIISKIDQDISEEPEIRKIVTTIKSEFSSIALKYMKNFKFFETSIFEPTTILTAFSNGITLLSPNRDIAEFKLKEYSKLLNASALILFNDNGLVIAEYASDPAFDMTHNYLLKYVFETLGPQYIGIFKNLITEKCLIETRNDTDNISEDFAKLLKHPEDVLFKTKLNDGAIILIKRMQILDYSIYVLMFLKNNILSNKEINNYLDRLLEDFSKILQVYIE
ncbi:MAG: hypothetical protein GF364_07815 [Candidatus Lokiarchaeota archaeon]|nr:hypothetical protein [Candidatus Lokiarchaeota archaeon]